MVSSGLYGKEISQEEGSSKTIGILSSLDKENVPGENLPKREDNFLYSGNTVLIHSAPTYHRPQVMAVMKEKKTREITREVWVEITGYAPLDPKAQAGMCYSGDPRITASGSVVRDGIVAANFLPFGTEIRIPRFFGDKVFVVKDRMDPRYTNRIDVLFFTQQEALEFGLRSAYIEVLK